MVRPGLIVWGIALAVGIPLGLKYLHDLKNSLRFKITGFGVPNFNNWVLRLPVTVQFHNPAKVTITSDNVTVEVYIKNASNEFVHIARLNQAFKLPPGKSTQTVVPTMNLQAIGGTFANTWKEFIATRSATIRADVTPSIQGYRLPMQSFTDVIRL